jgi:glycosyltransferase involved in cell wall biosynthesis
VRRAARDRLVFVHSSDEMYGADRILLDVYDALPAPHRERAVFWLPTDVPHGRSPLCAELERRGARVRHMELPVLRRAYRSPRALAGLVRRWFRLVRELRQTRPALVYCSTSAVLTAAPAARLVGVPGVVSHVQEIWTPRDARVLGPLGRACRTLVAISEPVYAALPPTLRRRAVVVPNATPEPQRVLPLDGRHGPLRFVVASRWNAWKGHRTLLSAWDRLDDPGELVVLGGPPPSGETTDVAALAAGLRHPESVRVVGEVPDVHPYVDDADVVVVPSDQPEPFGLVAVEAFARARPVVASAGGGLSDIVSDGHDGWLFPPGDVEALGRVLGALDRQRVTAAGARARATYESRYTADRYATEWRQAVGIPGPP